MQVDSSTSVARERVAVISSSGQTKPIRQLAPTLQLTLHQQSVAITTPHPPQAAAIVKTDHLLCSQYIELLAQEEGAGVHMVRIEDQEMAMMAMVVVMVEWDLEILEVVGPIPILIQAMDRLLCVTVEWKLYREQCRRQDRTREGSFSLVRSREMISVGSLNGQMMYHRVTSNNSLLPEGDLEVGGVVEAVEGVEPHRACRRRVLGQRGLLVKQEPLPLVAFADNRDTQNAHALKLSNCHDT